MSLILCIQYYPGDELCAHELCRLIADLEPVRRNDVEFAISFQRGSTANRAMDLANRMKEKFEKVHVHQCSRYARGFPYGANELWFDTMAWAYDLHRNGKTKATGILTFEADNVPLRRNWIDILVSEWNSRPEGIEIVGNLEKLPVPHINGNGIFAIDLCFKLRGKLEGCDARATWDVHLAPTLLPIAKDTFALSQIYRMEGADEDSISKIRKQGVVPALFHGIKGVVAIDIQRRRLSEGMENPVIKEEDLPIHPLNQQDKENSGSVMRDFDPHIREDFSDEGRIESGEPREKLEIQPELTGMTQRDLLSRDAYLISRDILREAQKRIKGSQVMMEILGKESGQDAAGEQDQGASPNDAESLEISLDETIKEIAQDEKPDAAKPGETGVIVGTHDLRFENRDELNDKGSPDASLDGDREWMGDLRKIAVEEFGFSEASAEFLAEGPWLDYKREGLTPRGALEEDMKESGDGGQPEDVNAS